MSWWVYILWCKDNSLYTGCTDNVDRRLAAHREGKGAKYTRGRGPLKLVYTEPCADRSTALKREAMVKKLKKVEKLALILSWIPEKEVLHEEENRAIMVHETGKMQKGDIL